MSGALDGIRVIDLTQALAGPFCTSLLADYGADVVKIEPPHGDMIRRTGPFASDDPTHDHGNVFQNANRNKRSLVIDLKSPAGRDLVLTLVRDADVLVENFSGGVMDRLGLSYETLADINPRLVYTSIRGFGDRRGGESPYAHWPAFDVVAQAMGGLMSITGESGGAPVASAPASVTPSPPCSRRSARWRRCSRRSVPAAASTSIPPWSTACSPYPRLRSTCTRRPARHRGRWATSCRASPPSTPSGRRTATSPSALRTTRNG